MRHTRHSDAARKIAANGSAEEWLLTSLRRWVLFSNRSRVLLRLNRLPYHAAMGLLRVALQQRPEIAGIYARNSFAQGHWVPGLSDIDLTVIVREGLEWQQEYEFCRVFHRRYAALRRFFPMLAEPSEVEILHASHVAARTSYAITGSEARTWKRVYGDHSLAPRYQASPERLRRDRLTHAVAVYHYALLPSLAGWPELDSGSELTCRRSLLKILRYLDVSVSPARRRDLEGLDPIDALLLALDHLTERTKAHLDRRSATETAFDFGPVFRGRSSNIVHRKPLPPDMPASESWDRTIECVVAMTVSPHRVHVLLRPGQDHDRRRRAADAALQALPAPLLTERNVFEYFLNFVNVLDDIMLLKERVLYLGDDPFPLANQPSRETFRLSVCQYAVDMFKYGYTPALWTASNDEFRGLFFGWFLLTLRYLEEGILSWDFDELYDYCRVRHPEYEQAVGSLHAVEDPRARFQVLRMVLDDMSRYMTTDVVPGVGC